MKSAQLKHIWNDFHRRVETYEMLKETEIRHRYPDMTEPILLRRLKRSVDDRFREETKHLLSLHLAVTHPKGDERHPARTCKRPPGAEAL